MPELKKSVLEAFRLLNIDVDATQAEAAKAYKTEALRHHPDKNPGDPAATQRFQKLGAAYDICLNHFENPHESYIPERGSYSGGGDDGIDPEDLAYFMFMFEEMIFGRFSRASRRDYRSRRGGGQRGPSFVFVAPFMSGSGGGAYYSSGGYSSYSSNGYSSGGYSAGPRQLKEEDTQSKNKTAYERRLREFEQEIEAEKRELKRQAMEKSKDENRRAVAYQQAFHAARTGNASTVIKLVGEYDLDVNSPEKLSKQFAAKKTDKATNFQTLLHAACRSSDEGLILFLLDKGAITDALNDAKLHPFHVAIACGNLPAVKLFLLRRVNGKFTPGCHPSKAAPDGRTPLQIAISSGKAEMIALMTKEATVHDVERCWQQAQDAQVKEILLGKKGFVDPETKEAQRLEVDQKLVEERQREERRVADERARQEEKVRLKEEKVRKAAEKRAAEELARQREHEALEAEKRRQTELTRQRREAEAAARRQAEEAAQEKLAAEARRRAELEVAEARRRAELEARAQAEAEAVRQAAEARVRAETQARQLAEEQERARRQAEEQVRRRKAAEAEAKRIQREAEAAAVRQEVEAEARRQADVHAEALRIAAAENARIADVAAQKAERTRRAALEQEKREAKRAETIRRLQAQAEEHARQAGRLQAQTVERAPKAHSPNDRPQEAQAENVETAPPPSEQQQLRRKLPKKAVRDLSQLSPEELQKRAAQSARDKVRIAEEKRRKKEEKLNATTQRPGTPESMPSNWRHAEDYIPPTPVSMPSPSQRRPSLNPPLVPRHTRPNVPAMTLPNYESLVLGPEDIQTGAIPDDLFAREQPVTGAPARASVPPPFRGYGRGRYRGRARGYFEGGGRGRGRGGFQRSDE